MNYNTMRALEAIKHHQIDLVDAATTDTQNESTSETRRALLTGFWKAGYFGVDYDPESDHRASALIEFVESLDLYEIVGNYSQCYWMQTAVDDVELVWKKSAYRY